MDCKPMMRICSMVVTIFFFLPVFSIAQTIPFYTDPVWSSGHFSPYTDGKEVKSYCALFAIPFAYGGYNYRMEILDNNFKTLRQSKISLAPEARIKHSSFNGEVICLTLETASGVLIKNVIYDITGDYISEYKIGSKGMFSNSKVYPVPNEGFIGYAYTPDQESILQMRSDSGKWLWSIYPEKVVVNEGVKVPAEKLTINSVNDDILILRCEVPEIKATDIKGNAKLYYRIYDIHSGKKINDLRKDEMDRILMPTGVTMDSNRLLVYGQFYPVDKTPLGFNGNESLGLYIHEFDKEGNLKSENYYPWADLAGYLKMDDDDSNTSVWLNDLRVSTSGVIYLMGELYRYSKVSGVSDVVVFELKDLANVDKVHRYPKPFDKSTISVLPPNDYLFGDNLHDAGAFGYRYSSSTSDRDAFSFVY